MERRRLSRGEAAFMIGVPLAWAVLLLFHPSGEGDQVYLGVQDEVAEMLAVHVGMMVFIPLIAVAVYLLLRGVRGPPRGSAASRSSLRRLLRRLGDVAAHRRRHRRGRAERTARERAARL